MIYIITILLIILTRVIYTRGNGGCRVSLGFEKIVIFVTAIMMMYAMFKLCGSVTKALIKSGAKPRDMTEHNINWMELSGLIVFPVGLVAYVLLILIVLPKPIRRAKNVAEQVAASDR